MVLRTTYEMARADLLDRVRGYRFLITLGITVYAAYMFVPPLDADYVSLAFGTYRGVYNSAYIGAMLALLTSLVLGLLGFYVVRGSIERDQRTGVGNILAASTVGNVRYLLTKMVSHFAVLTVMAAVVLVAAAVTQLARAEVTRLDVAMLGAPFVWITLPAMAFVAAMAVVFDVVRPLRGAFGNVMYFFMWGGATAAARLGIDGPAIMRPFSHLFGFTTLWPDIEQACQQVYDDCSVQQLTAGLVRLSEGAKVETFLWDGIGWNISIVGGHLFWVLAAVVITMLAAPLFHRFDPARVRRYPPQLQRDAEDTSLGPSKAQRAKHKQTAVSALWEWSMRRPTLHLIVAELHIMLKGRPRWWYVTAAGVIAAGILVPLDVARTVVLPMAFIWPLTIWSQMGSRETLYWTGPVVFTARGAFSRLLAAQWVSGIAVAAVLAGPILVRTAWTDGVSGLLAHGAGVLFVPALSLALGILTGGRLLFEVCYALLWYVSLQTDIPPLFDFMGRSTATAVDAGVAAFYGAVTGGLLLLAFAGRRRTVK